METNKKIESVLKKAYFVVTEYWDNNNRKIFLSIKCFSSLNRCEAFIENSNGYFIIEGYSKVFDLN